MAKELDAEIAEKVMGWEFAPNKYDTRNWIVDAGVWASAPLEYSTDIAAAFQVVSKLREKYLTIELVCEAHHQWDCLIYKDGSTLVAREAGETLPEAICKAALKALA